jgi:hypothetical protein
MPTRPLPFTAPMRSRVFIKPCGRAHFAVFTSLGFGTRALIVGRRVMSNVDTALTVKAAAV